MSDTLWTITTYKAGGEPSFPPLDLPDYVSGRPALQRALVEAHMRRSGYREYLPGAWATEKGWHYHEALIRRTEGEGDGR